jgi:NhaP-type Na+/H+ and K+/H+ antiporter
MATPLVVLALEVIRNNEKNYELNKHDIMQHFVIPFAIALAIAAAVAPIFAYSMDLSAKARDSNALSRAIVLAVLPLIIFGLSEVTGANRFVASFLSGLFFGLLSHELHHHEKLSVLIEAGADIMSEVTWFLAGES